MNYIHNFTGAGNYSEWSQWSTCTAPCGWGSTSRYRQCNNPEPLNGGTTCVEQNLGVADEAKRCIIKECPSNFNRYFHLVNNMNLITSKSLFSTSK